MRMVVLCVLALTFAGCSVTSRFVRYDGLKRASYDLDCAESELTITELGVNQVGVNGCGKRAVYVATSSGWVNNTSE